MRERVERVAPCSAGEERRGRWPALPREAEPASALERLRRVELAVVEVEREASGDARTPKLVEGARSRVERRVAQSPAADMSAP